MAWMLRGVLVALVPAVVLAIGGISPARADAGARVAEASSARAPQPSPKKHHRRNRPGRGVLPWLVCGAGAAAIVTGAVLIGLDMPALQDNRMNFYHRDSMKPGVALTAAGAAVLGVGAYLMVRQPRRREGRQSELATTLTPTLARGQVGLGIAGAFW